MRFFDGRHDWRLASFCACVLTLAACGGGGGGGSSNPSTQLPNRAPTAAAGTDQTVFRGEEVQLNGSASSDPDGQSLTYSWVQESGPAIAFTNPAAANPAFKAPHVSGRIVIVLTVTDGKESASDRLEVTIQNRVPTATAGNDLQATLGATVTLQPSASFDPDSDKLAFTWKQTFGPTVQLTQRDDGSATFQSPMTPGLLQFSLVASDGELNSNEDTIVVAIGGAIADVPFVDAGFDQIAPRNFDMTLWGWAWDGSYSNLTYTWTQISGPAVELSGTTSSALSFRTPNEPATFEFEVVVSNGLFTSVPDRITVTVQNFAPTLFTSLSPALVRTADDIIANISAFDWDGDSPTIDLTWKKNGAVVSGLKTMTFPHAQQVKGDVIELIVTASDGFETVTANHQVTVQDTPANYQASPPTEVNHGATFSFVISGTDPDGDPVGNFSLRHGPAGMTVAANGTVTWVARLPMFGPTLDVNYAVAAAGNTVPFSGTVTVKDTSRPQTIRRTGVEIPLRDGGLVVSDLDADGDREILVASYDAVQEYSWNGTDYEQRWVYPYYLASQEGITIAAADVRGDARKEIFIASGSRIMRLDPVTRNVSAELTLAGNNVCKKIEIANIDATGGAELVCLATTSSYWGPGRLIVVNPVAMTILWESVEIGGNNSVVSGLALGNVDADAALEIITGPGYVFDGATHNSQWSYGAGFGTVIDTGDVNGDGVEEIVAMQGWDKVRVFDAVLRSPIGELTGGTGGTGSILVRNIEGSASAEIIIGDAQWGNVTAYRYDALSSSGVQLFQINSQGHGVTAIEAGDVDNDGALEFVWGTDASSSGPDSLVVVGRTVSGPVVEWINDDPKELSGNFVGGMPAEISSGQHRLMFATPSTDNGYEGARLVALHPTTYQTTVSAEIGSNWSGAFAFDAADYDNDGVDELFLGSSDLYTGFFSAYDFSSDAEEWRSPTDVGVAQAVTHADFTGDGRAEMVAIANSRVNVFDVHLSNLVWRSITLTQSGVDVAVANLEGDSTPEIIAATTDRITTFRRHTTPGFIETGSVAVNGVTDLLVADTDGDGQNEIFVLTGMYYSDATIYKYSPTLQLLASFSAGRGATSLHLEDLTGARKNLVISTGDPWYSSSNVPRLRAIDSKTGAEVWQSPELAMTVSKNSLSYIDLDGDTNKQISFAAGPSIYLTR